MQIFCVNFKKTLFVVLSRKTCSKMDNITVSDTFKRKKKQSSCNFKIRWLNIYRSCHLVFFFFLSDCRHLVQLSNCQTQLCNFKIIWLNMHLVIQFFLSSCLSCVFTWNVLNTLVSRVLKMIRMLNYVVSTGSMGLKP